MFKKRSVSGEIIKTLIESEEDFFKKIIGTFAGKETEADLNLDGVVLHLGKHDIKLEGKIRIRFVPLKK